MTGVMADVAQSRAAGVPSEVVKLVAYVRHVQPTYDRAELRRARVQVDYGQCIRTRVGSAVKCHHIRDLLGRGLGGVVGCAVEGRVGGHGCAASSSNPDYLYGHYRE